MRIRWISSNASTSLFRICSIASNAICAFLKATITWSCDAWPFVYFSITWSASFCSWFTLDRESCRISLNERSPSTGAAFGAIPGATGPFRAPSPPMLSIIRSSALSQDAQRALVHRFGHFDRRQVRLIGPRRRDQVHRLRQRIHVRVPDDPVRARVRMSGLRLRPQIRRILDHPDLRDASRSDCHPCDLATIGNVADERLPVLPDHRLLPRARGVPVREIGSAEVHPAPLHPQARGAQIDRTQVHISSPDRKLPRASARTDGPGAPPPCCGSRCSGPSGSSPVLDRHSGPSPPPQTTGTSAPGRRRPGPAPPGNPTRTSPGPRSRGCSRWQYCPRSPSGAPRRTTASPRARGGTLRRIDDPACVEPLRENLRPSDCKRRARLSVDTSPETFGNETDTPASEATASGSEKGSPGPAIPSSCPLLL